MNYIDDEAVDEDANGALDLRASQPEEEQADTDDEDAITDHEVEAPFAQFESRRELEADISVGELTPRHAKAQVDKLSGGGANDSDADGEDERGISAYIRDQKATRKEQNQNETEFINRQKSRVSQAKANKRGKQRKSIVDESDEDMVRSSDDDLLASEPESEVELVFENEINKKSGQCTAKKPKTKMQVIRSQMKNQQIKQQKKKQQYDQESDDVLPVSKVSKSGASKGMASAKSTQQSKSKSASKMSKSSTAATDEAIDPVSDSEMDNVQIPLDESFVVDSESDEESRASSEGEETGSQRLAKARKSNKKKTKGSKSSKSSIVPSPDAITRQILADDTNPFLAKVDKDKVFKKLHGARKPNDFFGASDCDTSSDDSIQELINKNEVFAKMANLSKSEMDHLDHTESDDDPFEELINKGEVFAKMANDPKSHVYHLYHAESDDDATPDNSVEILSGQDGQPAAKQPKPSNNKPKPIVVDNNQAKMKPIKSPKVKSDATSPKVTSNDSSVSNTPSLTAKKAKVDSLKISGHDFIITHRGEELPKGFDISKPMRPKNGKAAVGRRHYTTVCRAGDKIDARKYSVVLLISGSDPVVLDKTLATKIEKQQVELFEMKIELEEWKLRVIDNNNIANPKPKHYQLMTCAERYESIKLSVSIQKRKRNENTYKIGQTEDEKEPASKKAKPSKPSQSVVSSKAKAKTTETNDTDDMSEDAKAMYTHISSMFDDKLNNCFLTALKAQTQVMVHSKDVQKAQDYMATLLGPINEFQAIKDVSSANQWTELQKQHPQEGKLEELLKFFVIFNPKAKQYLLSELKFLCKSTT